MILSLLSLKGRFSGFEQHIVTVNFGNAKPKSLLSYYFDFLTLEISLYYNLMIYILTGRKGERAKL